MISKEWDTGKRSDLTSNLNIPMHIPLVGITLRRSVHSEYIMPRRSLGLATLDCLDAPPPTAISLKPCRLPSRRLDIKPWPMDLPPSSSKFLTFICERCDALKVNISEIMTASITLLYGTSISEQAHFYPAALSSELAEIHAYWEDSLYAVTAFPGANEKNWRVLVMIEQIIEDRKLLGSENDADKKALVEVSKHSLFSTFLVAFRILSVTNHFSNSST